MRKIRVTIYKVVGSFTLHGITEFSAYCVCAVRGKKNERFKTPVERAAAPSWNHIQELTVDESDTLQFSIYNEVADGDELLARATLEGSMFFVGGFEGRLDLLSHGKPLATKLAIKIGLVDRSPRASGSPRPSGPPRPSGSPRPNGSPRPSGKNDAASTKERVEHQGRREEKKSSKTDLIPAKTNMDRPDTGLPAPHAVAGIKIIVVGAEGLRKADFTGGSDPYCVCTVQGKKGLRFKTPVLHDTQSPRWNYQHEFQSFGIGDSLQLSVFDQDIAGDDLLGRANLQGADVIPNGFSGKIPLQSEDSGTNGMLEVVVEMLRSGGESRQGFAKTLPNGARAGEHGGTSHLLRIRCTIIGARALRKLDFANRAPDAFCTCDVVGKENMHFETPVVVNKHSPTWNYALMFLEFFPEDSLELCVWDRGIGGDDLLGRVLVPSSDFIPSGFRGEVFLRDGGRNSQGTLSFRLEILEGSVVAGKMEAPPHAALEDWNEDTSIAGSRVWEWTPSPYAFELEYEVGWEIAIEEERRCGREVALILSRSRTDIYELRQRISQGEAEVAKLQQQLSFSEQPWQCRSCDRQQLNVQTLSRALNRSCRAVFVEYLNFTGTSGSWRRGPVVAHELLQEVTEALKGAAHIKPDIAELSGYLAHELTQRASLPEVQFSHAQV